MKLTDFDYELPKELIAQFPADNRDSSKMMVLNRTDESIEHKKFFDITDYFTENDVLVMNNTKVIPARLIGKKSTGATIEIFLVENVAEKEWLTLIKPAKRVREGTEVIFSEELKARIIKKEDDEKWRVELIYEGNFEEILDKVGNVPLPPYIERKLSTEQIKALDFNRYQTVYGSVAAPTAGLHFTEEVLNKLRAKGVEICYVNLSVGLGTFKPVRAENILDHKMDREYYEIPKETAETIKRAKQEGKNIVAVGTTSVRTLETAYKEGGALCGWSRLFIYPGCKFKVVDKLITNFHLPKSTLLMLVSAFAGRDFVFKAYKEAIEKKYRFYSYGDCMFLY